MLVIQWMKGDFNIQNFTLLPLFQEIQNSLSGFSYISFDHVYRNRNEEVDRLSKAGLEMDKGVKKIAEKNQALSSEYLHDSWI
jgi:hypothetical protein